MTFMEETEMMAYEIVDRYTPGLPEYQRQANISFIDTVWSTVKLGGVWGYPEAGVVFKKVEHHKWVVQVDSKEQIPPANMDRTLKLVKKP